MGRDSGLASALDTSPELAEVYAAGGASKEIIDTALKIENVKRSAGIHAAGVVIGRDPLEEHVPLKRGDHDEVVTQFDMKGVESLGLLKMDFLGLRNLTVIDLTLDNISANSGEKIDIDNPSLDDPKVFEMLSRGDTDGVFQLESDGMRRYLSQLKPTRFEHIMAMNALYRPGPMDQIPTYIERMNDSGKIVYLHPELEEVTKETFGVLVFQEQIVQTLQKIAGYSLGEADLVRKAIGKKNRKLMASEKPRFFEGCLKGGVDEAGAAHLWSLIERFADYSFNRAHAACYAYIAYQTAWLKVHHPVAYMAALLTSVKDRKDDKPKYLYMARKMGIPVLIPDVNSSELDFTPVGDSVRFGLSAVRGLGSAVAEKIIDARKAKGEFTSFHDFCRKVDYVCLNKKTLESLILAGAFESLGHTRKGLIEVFEPLAAGISVQRRNEEQGIMSLFGGAGDSTKHTDDPIPIDEFPRDVLRSFEKTALGLFVSDHPLLGVEGLLSRMTDASLSSLGSRRVGETVTVGGMVSSVRKRITRNGSIMVTMTIEDVAGAVVDVLVFAKTYEQYGALLQEDEILLVTGRIDRDVRNDTVQMLSSKIHKPDLGRETPIVINLVSDSCTPTLVDGLKEVLAEHPGSTQVYLKLAKGRRTTMLKLASEFWVDAGNGLHAELKALLGPACLA
jgi:DNA polymerase-3 subunit alpha